MCDLENEIGESSADTLDDSNSKHNFTSSIDVGVLDTQNVSEFGGFLQNNAALYTRHVNHRRLERMNLPLLLCSNRSLLNNN